MSVERQLRFLGERATFQLRSDRRRHPPYGLARGKPGAPSNNLLEDKGGWLQLPTKFTRALHKGQAFRHITAGGGGYGDPLERDPRLVLDDVRNGKVSLDAAERDYGVRILRSPWRIDHDATVKLRAGREPRLQIAPASA